MQILANYKQTNHRVIYNKRKRNSQSVQLFLQQLQRWSLQWQIFTDENCRQYAA